MCPAIVVSQEIYCRQNRYPEARHMRYNQLYPLHQEKKEKSFTPSVLVSSPGLVLVCINAEFCDAIESLILK